MNDWLILSKGFEFPFRVSQTKKSSQQQAFDTLTPEEKLVILDETIKFNEVLKSVGLCFYSLDKEDRLLKEAIIQSIHKIESM